MLALGCLVLGWLWLRPSTPYRLAYCRTMAPYAAAFQHLGQVEMVSLSTSQEVLEHLKAGLIDVGLVSRRARSDEVDPRLKERIVRESYALVGGLGRPIHVSDLFRTRIHTYLSREKVERILPYHPAVVYHADKEQAIAQGWQELVLIDWRDYQDEPLIMPMVSPTERMGQFRDPFVYYYPARFSRLLDKVDFSESGAD